MTLSIGGDGKLLSQDVRVLPAGVRSEAVGQLAQAGEQLYIKAKARMTNKVITFIAKLSQHKIR